MAAGDVALSLIISANDQASGVIYAIGAALMSLSRGDIFGAVAAAAVGVGVAIAGAAKSAGDFQQQITILQTGAGELASNLATDAQGIKDISVQTASTTTDLTAAMYQINSAGYLGSQGLSVLKAAAEGAKAENANLADVAKALTGVLHDFNIPASQATQVMNGMLKAVSDGKMKMDEFARALGAILPIAQESGVSFEDVSAAIGMMTNANIPAQQASRELAYLLRSLDAPSSVAAKAMYSVGLTAQEVKNSLGTKGLAATLQLIEDHIGKTFPANSSQAITALRDIVGGVYGLQSALAITGTHAAQFAKNVKDISDAMKIGGQNIADWSTIQDEFNFKVGAASSALNVLWINLGTELLPIFGKVVDWVTQIVVNFTDWENKSHFVESALNALVTALQFLGNILGYVLNVFGQLWDVVSPFFDNIVQAAYDWGSNFINNFASGIASAFQLVVNIVMQIITFIEDYLGFASPTRKGPGSKADKWGPAFIETLANGMTAHISYLEDAAESVALVIHQSTKQPSGIDTSSGSSNKLVGSTIKALDTACTAAKSTSKCISDSLTTTAAKAVKDNTAALEKAAVAAAEKAADAAIKAASVKATKAKATKPDYIGANVPALPPNVETLPTIANNIGNEITSAAKKATTAISPLIGWLKNLWQEIVKIAQSIFNFLKPAFEYMWSTAKAQLGPALAALGYALLYLIGDIANLIVHVAGAIVKFVQWLIQIGYFKTVWDIFIANMKAIIETITKVVLIIDDVVIAINKWLVSGQAAKQLGPIIIGIGQFFQTAMSTIKNVVAYAIPQIQSLWKVIATQLWPAILNLWDAIKPLVILIAELVIGFVLWLTKADTLKGIFGFLIMTTKIYITIISTFINILANALRPVVNAIVEVFEKSLAPSFQHISAAVQQCMPLLKAIGMMFLLVAGWTIGFIGSVLQAVGNLLGSIILAIGNIIKAFGGFIQIMLGLSQTLIDLFTFKWDRLGKDLQVIWQGYLDFFVGIRDAIFDVIGGLISFLIGIVQGGVSAVYNFFKGLYDDLVGHSIIPELANAIIYWFKYFINLIPSLTSAFIDKITGFFTNGWKTIETGLIAFWNIAKTLFSEAWTKYISTPLTDLWNNVKTSFDTAVKNVAIWGTNLVKGFGDAITAGIHWVTDAATSVANTVKSILGIQSPAQTGPLSNSDKWMPNLMNMFVKGINDGVPLVGTAMTNLANGVNGKFNTLTGDVNKNINQIIQSFFGLNTSIQSQTGQINNSLDLMQTAVRGSMEGAIGAVQNGVAQMHASSINIGQDFVQIGTGADNTKAAVNTSAQSIGQDFVKINIAGLQTKSGVNESLGSISATAKSTASTVQSTSSTVSTSLQSLQKDSKKFVDDILSSTVSWQTKLQEFGSSIKDLVSVVTSSISTIVNNITGAQSAVSGFSSATQASMSTALANTQSMAMQMNALLGHSVPSSGPLKDDDKWGFHFMQNITNGMQSGIPGLQKTTENVASILSSSIPDEYKTGTLSLSATATPPTQNMTIYMTLDGKSIGKIATKYQTGELRAQGVVRSI